MGKNNQNDSSTFSWWKVALMFIGLIIIITVLISFVSKDKMYYNLAAGIIISWIITLVVYYFWAIYFYNVNMGWTDADWENLEKKKNGQPGLLDDEPVVNPNAAETLGLPRGTVRATIALTLLIGALALMLASLELPHKLERNHLFIDNFEFIKTAFLMMVAFYFGNKSLDFLKDRSPVYGPINGMDARNKEQAASLQSPVVGGDARQVLQSPDQMEKDVDEKTNFEDKDAQG